jgi:hypothetical protein
MKYYRIGQLPKHLYLYVDTHFTHKESIGYQPCIWFGLVSYPSRAWGANLLLESGAIYRNVPLHALSYIKEANPWSLEKAQLYNCYSDQFTILEYDYLSGMKCAVKITNNALCPMLIGHYLFTVAPLHDGFSDEPEQNKELKFIALENGRITVQPTNYLKFEDVSFTSKIKDDVTLPKGLKCQKEIYRADEGL